MNMLRSFCLAFCLTLLLILPITATAQETGAVTTPDAATITAAGDASITEDPLTVTGIKIDKTDENAVKAREKAMEEAKRQAVITLAQRVLDASAVAKFKLPDDQTINTLIKDFEIKNEKLSKNRYVADFTIRFNDTAPEYIGGESPVKPSSDDEANADTYADNSREIELSPTQYTSNTGSKVVVILPYYKNPYGKDILWEDPNPWRNAWQDMGGTQVSSRMSLVVPVGDIDDIAAGSSLDIWKGDYKAINHLKEKYGATDIVIALAYKNNDKLDIEIHNFNGEGFSFNKTLSATYTGGEYKAAIDTVVGDKSLVDEAVAQAPAVSNAKSGVVMEISMFFNSFKDWMEVQKRINSITPKVKINIISLNSAEVKFNINVPSESAKAELENKFYAQGLVFKSPDFNYGFAGDSSDKAVYRYVLHLSD